MNVRRLVPCAYIPVFSILLALQVVYTTFLELLFVHCFGRQVLTLFSQGMGGVLPLGIRRSHETALL